MVSCKLNEGIYIKLIAFAAGKQHYPWINIGCPGSSHVTIGLVFKTQLARCYTKDKKTRVGYIGYI